MVGFVRKNKDPYSWSYHNDLIAAVGHKFEYHALLGVGSEFKQFLEIFYSHCPRKFPNVYFLSSAETDSKLPLLGFINPEIGIIRVLEHPLAKEFVRFVPWVFRESYKTFEKIAEKELPNKALPELYKILEDVRWVNHRLVHRNLLEEIIADLNNLTLEAFWEALPIENPIENWLQEVTQDLLDLKYFRTHRLSLPLPYDQEKIMVSIVFWLQLLDVVVGHPHQAWRVYWSETRLLFIQGPHSPLDILEILDPETHPKMAMGSKISLYTQPTMSLMKLLSCWRDVLKLQ